MLMQKGQTKGNRDATEEDMLTHLLCSHEAHDSHQNSRKALSNQQTILLIYLPVTRRRKRRNMFCVQADSTHELHLYCV